MMWVDCNGCDSDLMHHLEGCPLSGEMRGRLWLRDAAEPTSEEEEAVTDDEKHQTPLWPFGYGEWEPLAGDIKALAAYVRAVAPFVDQRDLAKLLDRAGVVFERWVEGFAPVRED